MAEKYFLGLDEGTTGTTALLLDEKWNVAARGYREHSQIFPQPGWVEHDPMEVWGGVQYAVMDACKQVGADPSQIRCIGIDNEGETVMMIISITARLSNL